MIEPRPTSDSAAPEPRLRAAVADAVTRWRAGKAPRPNIRRLPSAPRASEAQRPRTREEVLRPIPRRPSLFAMHPVSASVPLAPPVTFDVGFFACLARLAVWLKVALQLGASMMRDRLAGTSTIERRAHRMRESLERVGGTFVKLGQQIAMRIDLLPWEYCVEFSKMLDRMAPFPVEQALAAVERAAGRPWQEVFATFDPDPVGAASVACVYQAQLKDGTKVAVKIRRPGIGRTFTADFRVLDWLFGLVERLAIVRPGFTINLRKELRETLMEELDFRREAQFQHAFRRNARRRSRRSFFTAPRVHFQISNDEVLVQEFVSGMWLWEVIAAVEQNDPEGNAMMRRLNIDPAIVARRILWVAFWSIDENLFFHADPHPANIVVGPDSTLTFVDFGSCGSFDDEQRWAAERIAACMQNDDAEGMARATLKMLEPLPPVDVSSLMKEAQTEYVRVLATFRTKARHTEWWERTSARLWLTMVRVARQHNLPVSMGTLRMIRATLLYDTLVLRLDRTADRYKEYEDFRRDRADFARERWRKRARDTREQFLLRSDDWIETWDDLLDRAQHLLSSPVAGFSSVIEKSAFAFTTLSRLIWRVGALTAWATAVVAVEIALRSGAFTPAGAFAAVVRSSLYQAVVTIMVVLNVRRIFMRSREREVQRPQML